MGSQKDVDVARILPRLHFSKSLGREFAGDGMDSDR
jgi:hypothetical protein